MKLRLAAGLLAALLPSTLAVAQTMDLACPTTGTTFTYDSGIRVTAQGADGAECLLQIAGGGTFRLRGLLVDYRADDQTLSDFARALKPERLWPLKVGNKIEAAFQPRLRARNWVYTVEVKGTERIAGPGSAMIDTFLVEMKGVEQRGEVAITRWWISPLYKYAVRFEMNNGAGEFRRSIVTQVSPGL